MKTIFRIFIVAAIIGLIWWAYSNWKEKKQIALEQASPLGCYVLNIEKDVYTLKITNDYVKNFVGEISFKNFEKDSSRGIYEGTYENGVLLGRYSFKSEGMDSVIQLVFKKVGKNFIQGSGPYDSGGVNIVDPASATFDPARTFVATTECPI